MECNVQYLFILSCLYAHLTTHTVASSVKHRVVWWGCIDGPADRYVTNFMADVPRKSRQDFPRRSRYSSSRQPGGI